jgi:hypothetical protein
MVFSRGVLFAFWLHSPGPFDKLRTGGTMEPTEYIPLLGGVAALLTGWGCLHLSTL